MSLTALEKPKRYSIFWQFDIFLKKGYGHCTDAVTERKLTEIWRKLRNISFLSTSVHTNIRCYHTYTKVAHRLQKPKRYSIFWQNVNQPVIIMLTKMNEPIIMLTKMLTNP